MAIKARVIIGAALLMLASGTHAHPITANQANAIVQGCVAHATAKRQSHAIVVADNGGQVIASLRMDGNAFGIYDLAAAKARAAAAWGAPTEGLARGAQEVPGFDRAPHVITVPGGLPIFSSNGERIGAVGVSGEAPADDVACALSGIAGAKLKAEPR